MIGVHLYLKIRKMELEFLFSISRRPFWSLKVTIEKQRFLLLWNLEVDYYFFFYKLCRRSDKWFYLGQEVRCDHVLPDGLPGFRDPHAPLGQERNYLYLAFNELIKKHFFLLTLIQSPYSTIFNNKK